MPDRSAASPSCPSCGSTDTIEHPRDGRWDCLSCKTNFRDPSAASPSLEHPCPKCSPGLDVAVRYHPRRSYCEPHSRYTNNSREDEHLHYTCRNCGYDWTGDTADAYE